MDQDQFLLYLKICTKLTTGKIMKTTDGIIIDGKKKKKKTYFLSTKKIGT